MQNNNDVKATWEKFYSSFDPYGQEKWYSDRMRRKSTLELLFSRDLRFKNCLELGCGEGRITKKMLDICERITAVELSSNAINNANKNNIDDLKRVKFLEDDMYQVSFDPESFDLINGIESLDYIKDRKGEINKWLKWLKPEGYIIFSGPNLPEYFNYYEIVELFDRKELNIIEIRAVTSKFPLQWFINRIPLLQNNIFWCVNLLPAIVFPKLFSKHIAVLAKKMG